MTSRTIGQLASDSGVGVETVRFYERRGLVPEPPRTASGYRQYGDEAVDRVRFIRRAKELGFTLQEIQSLLDLRTDTAARCAEVREQIAAKLEDVAARIRDLKRVERGLRRLERHCESADPAGDCPTLDRLWRGVADPSALEPR